MFSGINSSRFVLCTVALVIFTYLFDMLVHGNLLMPLYNETPNLWRPEADMQGMMGWCIGYHLALAMVTTYIFTRNFEGKGLDEGVRFGFYIGLFLAVVHAGSFIFMPISGQLVIGWIVASLFWGVLSGVVLSLLYKR